MRLHFSTDVWSAGIVVLGLALILVCRVYYIDRLRLADPITALFVAGVIVSVSWRLARRTIDVSGFDAAPGLEFAAPKSPMPFHMWMVSSKSDAVRIRRAGQPLLR